MQYPKSLAASLVLIWAMGACQPPSSAPAETNENGDGDGTPLPGGDGDGDGDDNGDGDGDENGDGDTAEPQEVIRGERGSSCDSTNDCAEGLSCIVTSSCGGASCANKSCQPSDFDILGTGKQCHVLDCATKDDCCGDLPQSLPEKCVGREVKCSQPTLPECIASVCTQDADCDGGGTCGGTCNYDGEFCVVADDCAADECVNQICSISGIACPNGDECTYVQSCLTPRCDCTNPEYDPTDPICTDQDCVGICGFTCEDERCVIDVSCEEDTDCALATPFCVAGTCVECTMNEDCGEDGDIECVAGRCGPECEVDTQCGLFEACQNNTCAYVGCQTDRECVLGVAGEGQTDQRLTFCQITDGVGNCVAPCEIDAQCGPTEICFEGSCEYIGCETDNECKTITGLHDQPLPTDARPWTTTAVCRDDE